MAGTRNLKAIAAAAMAVAVAGCAQAGGDRLVTADPMVATGPAASAPPVPVTALAPVAPAPSAVRTPPMPAAAAAASPAGAARQAGAFPNINQPPPEREGQLLPPAERARIIAELEALRARQKAPAPASEGNAAELRATGQTHGAEAIRRIEQCAAAWRAERPPLPAAAAMSPEARP